MSIFGFLLLIGGACAFLAVVWAAFFAEDGDPIKNSVFRIWHFIVKCGKSILRGVACFFLDAGDPINTGTKKPRKRRSSHLFLRLLPRPKVRYKYKTYLTQVSRKSHASLTQDGRSRIRKRI